METKAKKSKLWIIVILLLVMNVLTLGTLWFLYINDPGHDRNNDFHRHRIQDFMKNKMQFTDEQNEIMIKLREDHFKIKNAAFDTVHKLKAALIDEIMKETTDTLAIRNISDKIGRLLGNNEYDFAMHFIKIKAICNTEQKKNLRLFLDELTDSGRPGIPGQPPPPRGGPPPFH
jgi:hypothetical protein